MELKEGEVICSKCHGSGNAAEWKQIPDYRVYLKCNHCDGEGKLDWIENITGKKSINLGFFEDNEIGLGYLSHPDNIYLDD